MILKDKVALQIAVGYVRTGCLDQAISNVQKDLIVKYAEEKGIKLIGIYEDTGLIRTGLNQLLEKAVKQEFNLVITDRVKNFLQKDEYKELFAHGVSLYFTQPGQDLNISSEKKKGRKKPSELKKTYLAAKQAERKIYSI